MLLPQCLCILLIFVGLCYFGGCKHYDASDNPNQSVMPSSEFQKYVTNVTEVFHELLIPDVIDKTVEQTCGMIYHQLKFENFTYKKVGEVDAHLGALLKAEDTDIPPFMEWYDADETDYYTVMILDMDAPSVQNPKHRYWLHWLMVNSKGYEALRKTANQIVEYVGPWPRNGTGQHRYVGLVYKQPAELEFSEKRLKDLDFKQRRNFCHRTFARKYELGEPECVNVFKVEWDGYVDSKYKRFYDKHHYDFSYHY